MSCQRWIHFIKCNRSTKSEYAALIEENEDILGIASSALSVREQKCFLFFL